MRLPLAALVVGCHAQMLEGHAAARSAPIPAEQVGMVAERQYRGAGASVEATLEGARLICAFQRIEGEATSEGLWLSSLPREFGEEGLRVIALEVGRGGDMGSGSAGSDIELQGGGGVLPSVGCVEVAGSTARFIRPGLTEEYSVSIKGVRQDFVIEQRPGGAGRLRVELGVDGARVKAAADGARLVADRSGRELTYNRLHVVDARGQELDARMEVRGESCLAVVVEDAAAVYPVRIDPVFSDANWASFGGVCGANDEVYAVAADDSGNVYIGGEFTVVGDVVANGLAKWDGSAWTAVGSGLGGTEFVAVYALAVSGTDLYVGGSFETAGGVEAHHIAKWDGSAWTAVGSGVNGWVHALCLNGTDLYAGGDFTLAGGVEANSIAKWDGSAWSALGSGMGGTESPSVYALAASDSDLYAGGWFTAAGGIEANYVAKWDGSAWSALGPGVGGGFSASVHALAVSGTDLYVGGQFYMVGDAYAGHIAKWDGHAWSGLGWGLMSTDLYTMVYALAVSGTDLYVGGRFTMADDVPADHIARWDGTAWSAVDSGVGGVEYPAVRALALSPSADLYAGGVFTQAGGVGVSHIARWNRSGWSALGQGMNDTVSALALSGNDLYVGGSFTTAGGVAARAVARWDGKAWAALGSGMNDAVWALAVQGTDLYAGGGFTMAGGVPADSIAKWDGITWSALGSGMNGPVHALAVSGNALYAGGVFTTAGGVPANSIAQWDGATWSALGAGLDGEVRALAVSGKSLYAGGNFARAGALVVNSIAQWDGAKWSALEAGLDGGVRAMALLGDDLYVGGWFAKAGGIEVNCIAKWDGRAWSALGGGMNGEVRALAVFGNALYAGGSFAKAGGIEANRIATWDGRAWSALGLGMDRGVEAFVLSGKSLIIGGDFTMAGTHASGYAVEARIDEGEKVIGGEFSALAYTPDAGFSCTFQNATIGQWYRIQTSASLIGEKWTDLMILRYKEPIVIKQESTKAQANGLFRAVTDDGPSSATGVGLGSAGSEAR
ncbi:MAG: hypothetical protein KA191_03525 [Verrucomicrobia bacterium]|nr:hypothetical protein [Verrucomicrobiota bacterium]MDI9380533.1 hypothetical protein [Verrucomicrobiota bacterium]NMD20360.1 hypothetical protein [Verrucomicrobiota bacterium]HOA59899.1 hypothetical protein [Verrucomicrobiota bacterium]HOF47407.1 hypothetical protein [Verrucomicrobiota bacterium]